MSNCRFHALVLLGLVGLSSLVQAVMIVRAPVVELDAVRFVETARRIDAEGLLPTLRTEREQPLFPCSVWVVHRAVVAATGGFRSDWALSAQLAAAVPLVLAVVPVYFIALRLTNPGGAIAGAFFFCSLPEVCRLGAAGISDSSHLLLIALAIWAISVYWARRRSPGWLLAAGLAAGMALLARAEVLVLLAAVVAALIWFQFHPRWQAAWPGAAAGLGCLTLGVALTYTPYLAAVGCLAPRAALARALGRYEPQENTAAVSQAENLSTSAVWRLDDGRPMAFDPKDPTQSIRRRGYGAAVGGFVEELADLFAYGIGILAALGAWRLGRRPSRAVDLFARLYLVLYSAAAIHFAAAEGYLSARHLLPWAVLGVGYAGHGAIEIGGWLAKVVGTLRVPGSRHTECAGYNTQRLTCSPVVWTMVLAAGGACLADLAWPLNDSLLGNRQAAEWLARDAAAPGIVLDSRGWTGLYSGRRTVRYDDARAAFADPRLGYVVLDDRELHCESDRCATLRKLLSAAGEPAATFPAAESARADRRVVVIYRWHPRRLAFWPGAGDKPKEDRHARARAGLCPERGRSL